MRKLATIQRIKNIEPIPKADTIEVATVLGWKVVVKKGVFRVGTYCIYCEVDSLLPEREEFEFLRANHFRIKTVRMRGQISQGICFPLTILPIGTEFNEGDDVSDLLGIVKYEPPIPECLEGIQKGDFPGFIPKTDETRIQVLEEMITKYSGVQCFATEKYDGTSVTYFIKDGEFGVCSKSIEFHPNVNNAYWDIAKQYDIENKLRELGRNIAIQGEIIGTKIQDNKYKLPGRELRLFSAFDIDRYEFYSYDEFRALIEFVLELPIVKTVYNNLVWPPNYLEAVDFLTEKSKIFSEANPDTPVEGIVIRPYNELVDQQVSDGMLHVGRLSFKVINPDFLLKYD